VATILAGACISEPIGTRVGQADRVIQLTVGQQPSIGRDRGATKLEHQTAVEIEPQPPLDPLQDADFSAEVFRERAQNLGFIRGMRLTSPRRL
jgi:hypothetical protein